MTLAKSCLSSDKKRSNKNKFLNGNENEANLCDKNITSLIELPEILYTNKLTRLTLAHNKIKNIPPSIADMINLEVLNLFNNQIDEIPSSISSMPKLRILNLGMNKLYSLPRGFGALVALEVLDLTYNNLEAKSFPANFFMIETLRALYLGDNDLETLPSDIGLLKNLQILVLRDNDLISLPKEIGQLTRLRELHIQNNRLTALPPEIGNLDLCSQRSIVRMDGNPWVPLIVDQLQLGVSHVIEHIRSDKYRFIYGRHTDPKTKMAIPPKDLERKAKKASRIRPK